jgi:hypothetical protein
LFVIHSNDDNRVRAMLGIPSKHVVPTEFVAIYDDITAKKKVGHATGSYTTTEIAFMVREYEQKHGKWTPPPEPIAAEATVAAKAPKKELAKAS